MKKNYYELLGVDPQATTEEIKTAAQHLAKKYHPSKYPGNTQVAKRFKQIKAVFNILANPQKRAAYDATLAKANPPEAPSITAETPTVPEHAPAQSHIEETKKKTVHSDILSANEKLIYQASIHWFDYIKAVLLIGTASYFLFVDPVFLKQYANNIAWLQDNFLYVQLTLGLLGILGGWLLLHTLWAQITTTVLITSQRTIARSGLFFKSETDIPHAKFEHIEVQQSLLGKLLGFGALKIRGTKGRGVGGLTIKVSRVAAPNVFEKKLIRIIRSASTTD